MLYCSKNPQHSIIANQHQYNTSAPLGLQEPQERVYSVPILKMKTLRPREVKVLAQCGTAGSTEPRSERRRSGCYVHTLNYSIMLSLGNAPGIHVDQLPCRRQWRPVGEGARRCKPTPIDGPPLFFRKRGWEPADSPASEEVSRVLLPGVESRDWASLATDR